MKALLVSALVLSSLSLAACDTTGKGYVDTQPPYVSDGRTAGSAPAAAPVTSAEPVFEKKVTK